MGTYFSRSSAEVEEVDISPSTTLRYPPKSGNFFASHFIMGGEKFETMQPESYLFGENTDLNFLGTKPFEAPYQISSPGQPLKALRCLVNIRKDSLRLVKIPRLMGKPAQKEHPAELPIYEEIPTEEGPFMYNVEFAFDADCPCSITIYYNATEDIVNKNVIYSPEKPQNTSDTVHFNAGIKQQFCLPSHFIDPAEIYKDTIDWTRGYTKIPIVIQVCADAGPSIVGHSHITYAEFYKPTSNSWSIRTVKQKQAINGVCYLIQEIFGIENKNTNDEDDDDDDNDSDDDSSDCVVCLSELRDTIILPCRHLCLCSTCANQLRYQQNGCPICRQSFRALLRIRAVRPKTEVQNATTSLPRRNSSGSESEEEDSVKVPDGYEVVPLIEAIRGQAVSNVKEQTEPDIPTPSTSRDEVSIIDETTKSSIGMDEIVIVTDDSDVDEVENHTGVNVLFSKDRSAVDLEMLGIESDGCMDVDHGDDMIPLPEKSRQKLPGLLFYWKSNGIVIFPRMSCGQNILLVQGDDAGTPDDVRIERSGSNPNVKEFSKKSKHENTVNQEVSGGEDRTPSVEESYEDGKPVPV